MGRFLIMIFAVLLIIMAFTVPSEDEYMEWAKEQDNPKYIDSLTKVNNFYIFKTFTIEDNSIEEEYVEKSLVFGLLKGFVPFRVGIYPKADSSEF